MFLPVAGDHRLEDTRAVVEGHQEGRVPARSGHAQWAKRQCIARSLRIVVTSLRMIVDADAPQ